MTNTIIIGAGLSGLSTAYHLKSDYKIIESGPRIGGLCKSDYVDGFTFDYAGHFLHMKDKYTEDLVKRLLGKNIKRIKRDSWIYSHETFTPYPYQCNLFGLPPNIIKECLAGFIKSIYERQDMKVKTFEDWIIKYLGDGIANNFMMPYNKKLWTVHPREMTIEWLAGYVPKPNLDEIIEGSLKRTQKRWGYNSYFYYPICGGIYSLVENFLKNINEDSLYCNRKVIGINLIKKNVLYDDGTKDTYEHLISTIPLNKLIYLIKDIPKNIKKQVPKLRANFVLNINFGISNDDLSNKHWIYFPERDYIFYRIGFPSNIAKKMVPDGSGSINTEISYSHKMPLYTDNLKDITQRVHNDLLRAKILKKDDIIICSHIINIKPAYVIYDQNWNYIRNYLLKYLKDNGLLSIGRYGAWDYSNMETAILKGKNVADIINNKEFYIN